MITAREAFSIANPIAEKKYLDAKNNWLKLVDQAIREQSLNGNKKLVINDLRMAVNDLHQKIFYGFYRLSSEDKTSFVDSLRNLGYEVRCSYVYGYLEEISIEWNIK